MDKTRELLTRWSTLANQLEDKMNDITAMKEKHQVANEFNMEHATLIKNTSI
ncbi:MAG: hypothetical protein NC113_03785 [Bacteroides sp.]|nr:hypothetical protein [Bacteroides sp.]MCM1447331.1 hypothetical protein [Bacteroides sp.]MCM1515820.1 hypothetical protein [Paraprevotella sp.]